ncbi:MAG: IPTL-CTERM sorting domain-containing protein [Comamonas sp.]
MTHPTNFRSSTRLALGLAGLLLLAHTQAQAQCVTPLQTFDYTGSIVSYSVPSTGDYWLEAAGAEGGNHSNSTYRPGRGAIVGGKFHLTTGTSLRILVGQQPSLSLGAGNGGGGGSFVVLGGTTPPQPLLVGGAGAGSGDADNLQKHGQVSQAGGAGSGSNSSGGSQGQGGANISTVWSSGAGGGLLSNGADGGSSSSSLAGTGGLSWVNGGTGGVANGVSIKSPGGFGGGGGGSSSSRGGAGGGYSGGGSGGGDTPGIGGGGGSYNTGGDPIVLTGAADGRAGHGQVRICTTNAPTPLTAAPATLTAGVVGSAYGPITLSATGGLAPYTWSGLPTGMSVDEGTGELSGTPAAGTQGSYTITVSDSYQTTPHSQSLSLTVYAALALSPSSLPDATVGTPYTQAIMVTGGKAPTIDVTGLPAGLSFDAAKGLVTGTPTNYTPTPVAVTITVTDGMAPTLTQTLSLTVNAGAVIAATPVPTMNQWALALMGMLAAVLGLGALRRKSQE